MLTHSEQVALNVALGACRRHPRCVLPARWSAGVGRTAPSGGFIAGGTARIAIATIIPPARAYRRSRNGYRRASRSRSGGPASAGTLGIDPPKSRESFEPNAVLTAT